MNTYFSHCIECRLRFGNRFRNVRRCHFEHLRLGFGRRCDDTLYLISNLSQRFFPSYLQQLWAEVFLFEEGPKKQAPRLFVCQLKISQSLVGFLLQCQEPVMLSLQTFTLCVFVNVGL